jgi:hypothetical protein
LPVYLRTKQVRGRRYLYLVEGKREGGNVRQRTLCYLGPLWRLVFGVPEPVRASVDSRLLVDWREVNDRIARIHLTFEELSEARRARFATSVRTRGQRHRPTQGDQPRSEGELAALSKLAELRFRELFEEAGPRDFRMR